MERPGIYKKMKWLAYRLMKDYNILMDVPSLMNWPNKKYVINDDLIDLCDSYADYFDEMYENCRIIPEAAKPTRIIVELKQEMEKYGKMEQVDKFTRKFIYNDPNQYVIHLTDHLGKLKSEASLTSKKSIIDDHSVNMGDFRDIYNGIAVDISQFNRSISSMDRLRFTEIDATPSDFKESSEPYENADIVLGLVNPVKLQVTDYDGYDVKRFTTGKHNRFRALKVLKNSYGADDFKKAFMFFGENGFIKEIPNPKALNDGFFKSIQALGTKQI